MTNKEAIKYLIEPVATSTKPSEEYKKQKEAYDMAIEALESELASNSPKVDNVNGDLISRQMVLRCIKELRDNVDWGQSEDGDAFLHYTGTLYRSIASEECLPSAEPERKKGKWIFNPSDAIEAMFTKPKCSECGFESADGGNFCPNCGARMSESLKVHEIGKSLVDGIQAGIKGEKDG